MYRIDDNTYIDTSLITCAEYQLFVDEMSSLGKYYQPDHWSSSQFPSGFANFPVLGVRSRDAIEFSEWLTEREKTIWGYRLPLLSEAISFPVQDAFSDISGYWVTSQPSQIPKVLSISCNNVPIINQLSHPTIIDTEFIQEFTKNPDKRNFHQLIPKNIIRDIIQALDRNLDHDRSGELEHLCTSIISQAREISASLPHSNVSEIEYLLSADSARISEKINHLINILNHEILPPYNLVLSRNLIQIQDFVSNIAKDSSLESSAYKIDNICSLFGLIINLILLKERIVGYYPAFEGIRIVKERKPE